MEQTAYSEHAHDWRKYRTMLDGRIKARCTVCDARGFLPKGATPSR